MIQPAGPLETFFLFHHGAPVTDADALHMIDLICAWSATGEAKTSHIVEVWSPADARRLSRCLTTAMAVGASVCSMELPSADNIVAALQIRGIAVRHRHGRRATMDDAELCATASGHTVRYL